MNKTKQFIVKSNLLHGDKYDYSLVEYITSKTKVKIVCPEHGIFEQIPNAHLSGQGCRKCANQKKSILRKKSLEETILEAKKTHGDKYDYSLVSYEYTRDKVKIICPEHGVFEQIWVNHCRGSGCSKCASLQRGNVRKLTTEDFTKRAKKVHGDKYDYSLVDVRNYRTKVKIICPEHGVFEQSCENHYSAKSGCPKCGELRTGLLVRKDTSHFIDKSRQIHGDKYDYSLVDYVTTSDKVKIICHEHGVFEQVANIHTSGCGCPSCGVHESKAEVTIQQHLDSLGVSYVVGDRTMIKPYELDIYIPKHKIAIEYNGLIWHSEKFGKDRNYHYDKTKKCNSKGIRLVHIWEDDFNSNQQLQLDFITHILGMSISIKTYARKLEVKPVNDRNTVRSFLNKYHVQQDVNYTDCIGLYSGKTLVSVGCFTKRGSNYELVRYCNSHIVMGGLGKVVKFYSGIVKSDIFTFCDLSRFDGKSYLRAGFKLDKTLEPDYRYLINDKREHKFNWRKKQIKNKYPNMYSENLTEKEMMEMLGFPRIWDCGKSRYVYVYSK